MQDSNLILFSGALSANQTGSWFDLGKGGVANFFDVRVYSPTVTGTGPTLLVQFDFGDDGSTVKNSVVALPATVITTGSPNVLDKRLRTQNRYVRVVLTVGGTSPNFGTTTVTVESGLGFREANIPNT
jgi:hypothetical protein